MKKIYFVLCSLLVIFLFAGCQNDLDEKKMTILKSNLKVQEIVEKYDLNSKEADNFANLFEQYLYEYTEDLRETDLVNYFVDITDLELVYHNDIFNSYEELGEVQEIENYTFLDDDMGKVFQYIIVQFDYKVSIFIFEWNNGIIESTKHEWGA